MDTLTHALSGALLARAVARAPVAGQSAGDAHPSTAQRMIVCATAAAFPDIDIVAAFVSPLTYLLNHRGVTHSLLLLPLWALLLAWLAALAFRKRGGWKAFYGIAALGLLAHIVGDLITSYGTMILAPFSDRRFAWGTTFIIDLWFSGIILAGLACSAVWKTSRAPAAAALLTLAAYVGGLQLYLQHRAIQAGREHAQALGWADARVSALARAVSPFNWTVIVERDGDYRYAHVNLRARDVPDAPGPDASFITRMAAVFYPVSGAVWQKASRYGRLPEETTLARDAWSQEGLAFFRWFADYPMLLGIAQGNPSTCVWFHDLRFANPGVAREPFRYGMCREQGAGWQAYEMLGNGNKIPVR